MKPQLLHDAASLAASVNSSLRRRTIVEHGTSQISNREAHPFFRHTQS
jgi:hypothetical protein